MTEPQTERLPLAKAAEFVLEECRMVLPGIQALFGFQLIVVFSPGFETKLNPQQQAVHLAAIALVVLAVVLIMAPAAYNRQSGPHHVSDGFVRIATRLLLMSMLPLALAISLDFYLIAHIIIGRPAAALAIVLFAVFVTMWFALPRTPAMQAALGRRG